jgi:hypothetical protein
LICQQKECCLLTNNRNDDGPDSLEATIRSANAPSSLPVFTFSDADRIFQSKDYAERVVESLFDKLLRIDDLRGAGQLYLPLIEAWHCILPKVARKHEAVSNQ